jgi:hypothetical protein
MTFAALAVRSLHAYDGKDVKSMPPLFLERWVQQPDATENANCYNNHLMIQAKCPIVIAYNKNCSG